MGTTISVPLWRAEDEQLQATAPTVTLEVTPFTNGGLEDVAPCRTTLTLAWRYGEREIKLDLTCTEAEDLARELRYYSVRHGPPPRDRIAPSVIDRRSVAARADLRVEHKLCGSCAEIKPASDFNRSAARPDGLQSECRACSAARRERRAREAGEVDGRRLAAPR